MELPQPQDPSSSSSSSSPSSPEPSPGFGPYGPYGFDSAPMQRPKPEPPPEEAPLDEKIEHMLKQVYDPEIPVSIYELGLIYEVNVRDGEQGKRVFVEMTLTTPNCPEAQSLPQIVQASVESLDEVESCEVSIVWSPPWNKDMMSDEAKLVLGLM